MSLCAKRKLEGVFFSSVVRKHRIANREGSGVRLSPISGEIELHRKGEGLAAFATSMQFVKMTHVQKRRFLRRGIYISCRRPRKKGHSISECVLLWRRRRVYVYCDLGSKNKRLLCSLLSRRKCVQRFLHSACLWCGSFLPLLALHAAMVESAVGGGGKFMSWGRVFPFALSLSLSRRKEEGRKEGGV